MCVHSTHVYVYARRRDEILKWNLEVTALFTNMFFLQKTFAKDVNAKPLLKYDTESDRIDPQSKVLNHFL